MSRKIRTERGALAAVRKDGQALRDVPKNLRTEKVCLEAVRQNGRALLFVPEDVKTSDMCMAAVQNNGNAIAFVPRRLETVEICLASAKALEATRNGDGLSTGRIPEQMQKRPAWLAAAARAISEGREVDIEFEGGSTQSLYKSDSMQAEPEEEDFGPRL